MIEYQLAQQLKNAGFPKDIQFEEVGVSQLSYDIKVVNAPTLSELIEACGDGFRSLTYHSKRTEESTYRRWIAKSGTRTGKFLKTGKTPEEAVAKLWLALQDQK